MQTQSPTVEQVIDTVSQNIVDEQKLMSHLDNCYKLFDPERTATISEMLAFIKTQIDPIIILASFMMNTGTLVDLKINDTFIQNYLKQYQQEEKENTISQENLDELVFIADNIKLCVFSGKPLEECSVFLNTWTRILTKQLEAIPETQDDLTQDNDILNLDDSTPLVQDDDCNSLIEEVEQLVI